MRKFTSVLLIFGVVLLAWNAAAYASQPYQQTTTPSITSFTAAVTQVSRAALTNRTARVPVSWATANRPSYANLFFEQVLADGTVVNVELPRTNPVVASSGEGVAAPVLPGGDATTVQLRLRLLDPRSQTVFDAKEITLTISDAPIAPTIRKFTTPATAVNYTALINRTARIPVSWAVDNRPDGSNLLFEQVLADGTILNVELPRSIPLVASEGDGVTAPVQPGASADKVQLRLRLVNLADGKTLAQNDLNVTVDTTTTSLPTIRLFTTTATTVSRAELSNRTARIPVSWAVDNRPDASNLVFEQMLDDNTVVNVELPRSNPFVTSSGNGVAAPVLPGANATSVRLRLRLIDLNSRGGLAQRDLTLTISDAPVSNGRIRFFNAGVTSVDFTALTNRTARIPVSWAADNRPEGSNLVFEQVVNSGNIVNVELPRSNPFVASEGGGVVAPLAPSNSNVVTLQLRLVKLSDNSTIDRVVLNIAILGAPIPGVATTPESTQPPSSGSTGETTSLAVKVFSVTPNEVARGGSVTFNWEVSGAAKVNVVRLSERGGAALETIGSDLPATGSLTYSIPANYVNGAPFALNAVADNGQETQQTVSVTITCPFSNSLVSGDCPVSQDTVSASYQVFENGAMAWRGDKREIYVLYNNGQWEQYADTWAEGETLSIGDQPPAGRTQPERGFGKVWATQAGVRDKLGWALSAETPYTAQWEVHQLWDGRTASNAPHFKLPDGRSAHLEVTWRAE
jgi:hypothetical protein